MTLPAFDRSDTVAIALASGVGVGFARGDDRWFVATEDPVAVVAEIQRAGAPRWVWWGRETSGLLAGLDLGDGLGDAMVWVACAGAFLAVLASLGVVAAVAQAMRSGVSAGDDPWHGHTLEWATATPVPAGNFADPLDRVTSESPLLDAAEAGGEGGESA